MNYTLTNYYLHNIQLILTPSFLKYIKEGGEDMGIETFEDFENFYITECGEDALKAEIIKYMESEKLIFYFYPNPITMKILKTEKYENIFKTL